MRTPNNDGWPTLIDFNFGIKNRGESRLGQCLINPQMHESMIELYETITEEIIHEILTSEFGTTEDQDHFFLKKLGFIDEWINE